MLISSLVNWGKAYSTTAAPGQGVDYDYHTEFITEM